MKKKNYCDENGRCNALSPGEEYNCEFYGDDPRLYGDEPPFCIYMTYYDGPLCQSEKANRAAQSTVTESEGDE